MLNKENENIIFVFENGKAVRVPLSAYQTKGNRKKLVGAYSDKSPIVSAIYEDSTKEILMVNSAMRAILIKSSLIPLKETRASGGVTVFNLKKDQKVIVATDRFEGKYENPKAYRKIKIPATGTLLAEEDVKNKQLRIE